MPIYKYDVCFPNSQSVIRTFPSLTRARDFMRVMSADDLPFLVMPWDENSSPLIVRRVKTPRKYHTQKAVNVAILGPSLKKNRVMLKTVKISANSKTGPIAVTYRSGEHETYGTCPTSCSLHPKSETGTSQIDSEYLAAVFDSVPRGGQAWTYSHFTAEALPFPQPKKTVINASCDTTAEAVRAFELGRPAVYAAPLETADQWPQKIQGVNFVQCPAELADNFSCQQCGGGRPLCARPFREFVVVFVAHGTGKKKVGKDEKGGCYAASGPVAIQWHKTRTTGAPNDAAALREFVRTLPHGSFLRHHIAGDCGLELGAA